MNKNKLMILSSFGTVLISIIVFLLHQLDFMSAMHSHSHAVEIPEYYNIVTLILLIIPIILLVVTMILYKKGKDHTRLPLLITLTLTFSSISTIAAGEGMVEYHFSLFMAVAIIAFYEDIKLLLLMSGLFIFQHLAGFFIPSFTIFVFGTTSYSFSMILIHAIFLSIITAFTLLQILTKKQHTKQLQLENERHEATIDDLMRQLNETGEKIMETVNQLNESSQQSSRNTQQVTGSIQQMASGAETQLQMTYDNETLLAEMTKGIEQIATSASIVVEASTQTTEEANQGKETVQKTVNQIHIISEAFTHLSDVITNLENRAAQINEIITVISDISTQTNLLSLNAAIEAARAGEFGKGFAVVADEVRKLADQSEQSVDKVVSLIEEIQTETDKASKSMHNGSKEVKQGINFINETGDLFHSIMTATGSVNKQIHETAAVSQQLAAGSDQVLLSMNKMTDVAKETVTNSEMIVNASEKQHQSIENINEMAGFLQRLVDDLNRQTLTLSKSSL